MKSTLKSILWIPLIMINLNCFSQIVTDSTWVQFKKPLVRLVIKDLIKGDGAQHQLTLFKDKIDILHQKILLQDSTILSLNSKLLNFTNISLTQSQQLKISQDLSKILKQDLKKQKLQTKLFKYSGGAAILGIIILIIK